MVMVTEDAAETDSMKAAMVREYTRKLLRPPEYQAADPDQENTLTGRLKEGALNYWRYYYLSLDELDTDLEDAVKLRADLIYGGKWYPKSGKLLDALFIIRTHTLEEKLKIPDPESAEMLFQQEELRKIKEYFTLPPEQRWSQQTVGNRLGLNQNAYEMLSALENNYLVPLRIPLAGRPLPGNNPI